MVKYPPIVRRTMPRLTEARAYRLRLGIPLVKAAVYADFSLSRASEIERFPARARPGELERLLEAVDRAASEQVDER
jgi:hypothetical protein